LPASSDREHHDDGKKAQKQLHWKAPSNKARTCTRQFIAVNNRSAYNLMSAFEGKADMDRT
jgi:hypothetical protein